MPVTKLESSEARNSAALAISPDVPMRPIGTVDTIRAMASGGAPFASGVSVGPGLRTFERIRRSFVEVFLGDLSQRKELTHAGIGEDNVDSSVRSLDGFVEAIEVG